MEDRKTPIEYLLERGQAYANTTIQLLKLKGARIVIYLRLLLPNFIMVQKIATTLRNHANRLILF